MISFEDVLLAVEAFLDDKESLVNLDKVFKLYIENPRQYRSDNSWKIYDGMKRLIFRRDCVNDFYYLMSAMYKMTMIKEAYYDLIRYVTENELLCKETRYFAYWQLENERFLTPEIDTKETRILLDELYEEIYQEYLNEFEGTYNKIPVNTRNDDLVIVLISQFLTIAHGPTKTVLDRCYILSESMNKKVHIINTADLLTSNGMINWFGAIEGSYLEKLSTTDFIEYRGCRFSFFQCSNNMPDVETIREILSVVSEVKPKFILSIGGSSITADMCSKIVPVLTVSTIPSQISQTRTSFQMTGRRPGNDDKEWLVKHGMDCSNIICGGFTWSFRDQINIFSREELGIPKGKVTCVVIGMRLDDEISEEFINVIRLLAEQDIYTVFVGKYTGCDYIFSQNDPLRNRIIDLGFQEDVLAVCECCDIYINPKRIGGGTSAAEAMYKGLPVVTLDYGDVAVGAGEQFCVKNYDEMLEKIIKMATDKDYYEDMSSRAKERAAIITDSKNEFVRIINEMESRNKYW